MKRLLVILFFALAAPLLAGSPEYLIGDTVAGPAPHLRGFASTATDGTDFFVVWSDERVKNHGALFGTRMRRNGQVLDPLGIRIAELANYSLGSPNVVWDGGGYLVTWIRGYGAGALFAARLDRDGYIVMAPREIANGAAVTPGRYVATNGTVTVIVYRVFEDTPYRIAVLDRNGNTLRDEGIAGVTAYHSALSVAASASHFLVAWSSYLSNQIHAATTYAVTLNSVGHPINDPVAIGAGADPFVGSDGTRFLVLSGQYFDGIRFDLYSRTVDATLTQITPMQTLTSAFLVDPPSVLWRGNQYDVIVGRRITAGDEAHLVALGVDSQGNKLGERDLGAIALPYQVTSPSAVTNGSELAIAFTKQLEPYYERSEIFSRVYEGNATTPAADQLLTWSGNAHEDPHVASNGNGHLVVWREPDGVFMTRVDASGRSIDGRGIALSNGSWHPRVEFNGTHYVVAWPESYGMGVRYVDPATANVVASVNVPATVLNGFALTVSSEATFLAYIGGEEQRVNVVRIPHSTHVPDPVPLAVSPKEMFVQAPALAWNGSNLLVVWNEVEIGRGDPPIPQGIRLYAARVSSGLTLLDPAPLLLGQASEQNPSTIYEPSVASNGSDWLVIAAQGNDVVGRRVTDAGTLEGSDPVKIATGYSPSVAFDGSRYAVAWFTDFTWPPDSSLVVASVPSTGALAESNRQLVSTNVTSGRPAFARAAGTSLVFVYSKLSHAPEHDGVERTYLRVMDSRTARGRVIRR